MAWKPETKTQAVQQDCPRCGQPTIHQRHGLPFTVTTDAEKLTPGQAAARTNRNRLAWCLRESKWSGARLVEVLSQLHNPACPWAHVIDHICPPRTPATPKPEGTLW